VKAAFAGMSINSSVWPYMDEYLVRKRMAKLGYSTSFDDLDDEKAQIFVHIAAEIEKHGDSEIKKNGKRRSRN